MRTLNEKKNLLDMLAAVKAGRITVIKDQYGNVKGIGVNHPDLKVSEVSYVKQIGSGQAVGRTLEELEADEAALREWASTHNIDEVLEAVRLGEVLNKTNWDEDDVAYLERELTRYIDEAVAADRRNRPSTSAPARTAPASAGKYPNLLENLHVLDVETLKAMKREATRNGADDLKNACRTVLRHKGVNC